MVGLLKFVTCGSVDDGKSTLIGHLLYDAKLLFADQKRALELDSKVGSRDGKIDYSLLLDGLMAEREQGITIDVAYRYFTTDYRSFICADAPGHEEYTRNMAVGASFADLAVILVDASKGVLVQTRRHARICAMMGIRYFVFAINKMDLVGYSQERFEEIHQQIRELSKELGLQNVVLIPVSATEGDNVTHKSAHMPWYTGKDLLSYLEAVDVEEKGQEEGFYMPVQRACRPNLTFRGFEGQVESGEIHVGDEVTCLGSGEKAEVVRILCSGRDADHVIKGQAATLQLGREVDVSRGCVLEKGSGLSTSSRFEADILWMDDVPLKRGKSFFVKIGTDTVPGRVTDILYSVEINTGEHLEAEELQKNAIARCVLQLSRPCILDEFDRHRTMGELILVDRVTYMTSACGVVRKALHQDGENKARHANEKLRAAWMGQKAMAYRIPLGSREGGLSLEETRELEWLLMRDGRHTYLYKPEEKEDARNVLHHLLSAGLVVLLAEEEGRTSGSPDSGEESVSLRNLSDVMEKAGGSLEALEKQILEETNM